MDSQALQGCDKLHWRQVSMLIGIIAIIAIIGILIHKGVRGMSYLDLAEFALVARSLSDRGFM